MQAIARAFYLLLNQNAGFSEGYPMTVPSLGDAMTHLQELNTDRLACATTDVKCVYLSVSDISIFRDVITESPTTVLGTYVPTSGSLVCSPGYNRLLCRFQATAVRRGNFYFGALPFDVLESPVPTAPPPWPTRFNAWIAAVIAHVSVRSKNIIQPPPFTDYAISNVIPLRYTHRPVGRPFGLPRGRRQVA